jgi:nucleoside 2-deoxyribosyltransferase
MALKAYIGLKFHQDARNRHTIDLISEALNSAGFETVCIHRDVEFFGQVQLTPKDLMAQTFDIIRSCQLVVIELTEKGVGLGIEAGYAHARDIPVVTVAYQGADISNTLRGISRETYSYNDAEGLCCFFRSLAEELS